MRLDLRTCRIFVALFIYLVWFLYNNNLNSRWRPGFIQHDRARMGSEHRDHPPGLHVEKEPYPPWRARMELLRRVHCSSVRRISGMQGQRNDSSQSKKKDQFIDQECALERTLMGCSNPTLDGVQSTPSLCSREGCAMLCYLLVILTCLQTQY